MYGCFCDERHHRSNNESYGEGSKHCFVLLVTDVTCIRFGVHRTLGTLKLQFGIKISDFVESLTADYGLKLSILNFCVNFK